MLHSAHAQARQFLAECTAQRETFCGEALEILTQSLDAQWAGLAARDEDTLTLVSSSAKGPQCAGRRFRLDAWPNTNADTGPCAFCEAHAQTAYPGATFLAERDSQSFRTAALSDRNGTTVAHILLLHSTPQLGCADADALFSLSARRICAEYLRTLDEQSNGRFKDFAESSSEWFIELDAEYRITFLSDRFEDVMAHSPDELMGLPAEEALARVFGTGPSVHFMSALKRHEPTAHEFLPQEDSNCARVIRITVKPFWSECGGFLGFRGAGQDITIAHNLTQELVKLARNDALTGLANRRELEQRVEFAISSAHAGKAEHVLCYVDLDQFKIINDTCGHAAGDDLLRELAHLLGEQIRTNDTFARLGGDEFGVLLENCSIAHAQRVADALRKTVEEFRFQWKDNVFALGASVGVVPITQATRSVSEVLGAADAACYVAKEKGRNRVHLYNTDDEDFINRHGQMQWVSRINNALTDNRFCLYAQPIVPVMKYSGEEKVVHHHVEILLRMLAEDGTIIPPGAFLPAAERYNVIARIDRWVIEQTLVWLQALPRGVQQHVLVSVNLSGDSLGDARFLDYLLDLLIKTDIDVRSLCFEITETAAISNLAQARRFMSQLKSLNCQFALDDFGSGFSSFAYLKHLPVDYLKIDGSFVRDIVDDAVDLAMVRSISDVGRIMKIRTIAEFVENDEILAKLREVGVDYAQGYGIGRPKPLEHLVTESIHESSRTTLVASA